MIQGSCKCQLFVNPALVIPFRDLPAWECFPAPAVSGGEFHHPHSWIALGISWSFPPKLEKMVLMAFMWQSSISEFILCLNKWNWLMFLFFLVFFSLPNIYRPWIIFINRLLRKYGTNYFGSFILSGELNGDVKGAACNNKSVLQMACQEKDTESLKSLQTELWWASRGIHVNDIAPPHFSLLAYPKCLYWLCICPPSRPFLTAEQNHLLHLVVQERITPSGQGI